jgi:hypothetical protein
MRAILEREVSSFERTFVVYELQRREIFARAYAQFIATRSGDAKISQELSELTDRQDELERYRQWTPNDFARIDAAMAESLRSEGYLR